MNHYGHTAKDFLDIDKREKKAFDKSEAKNYPRTEKDFKILSAEFRTRNRSVRRWKKLIW